jgi:hypothetical protein
MVGSIKDDLRVALTTALCMSEMVAAGLAEAAAGFARIDKAAAIRMVNALDAKFRADVAKQRERLRELGHGTQPMNAMQRYLDDAILASRQAIEAATRASH